MRNDPFDVTSKPSVVGRIVTATVALICVLIVYDGWAALKPSQVVLVIVGPVVAIVTTHVFSGSLVQLVALGRPPTTQEWLATARFELRFLLLAVPPLAVLLVLQLADVALTDTIRVVIWLEALSLSFWAGLAAGMPACAVGGSGFRSSPVLSSAAWFSCSRSSCSRGRCPRNSQRRARTCATGRR